MTYGSPLVEFHEKGYSKFCGQMCELLRKGRTRKTRRFIKNIYIPTLNLDDVNLNFVVGFPRNRRLHDSIWDIIDR